MVWKTTGMQLKLGVYQPPGTKMLQFIIIYRCIYCNLCGTMPIYIFGVNYIKLTSQQHSFGPTETFPMMLSLIMIQNKLK